MKFPYTGHRRISAVVLLVVGPLAGCTQSLLYDEQRDKQGQNALTAVNEVQLQATIEKLEQTLADVASREEDNARNIEIDLIERDIRLASDAQSLAAVRGENNQPRGLVTLLTERLKKLGAAASDDKRLESVPYEIQAAMDTLTVNLIELRGTTGLPLRSCPEAFAAIATDSASTTASADAAPDMDAASDADADADKPGSRPAPRILAEVPTEHRKDMQDSFAVVVEKCLEIDDHRNELLGAYPTGLIKEHLDDTLKLELTEKTHALAKRKAQDELDQAITDFENAEKKDSGKSALKQFEARADSLARAVATIADVQGQFLPRSQVIASETLKRLEAMLAIAAGQSTEGKISVRPADRTTVAYIRAIPSLMDEANALLKEANRPRLVPLLAAIDHHKLLVQGYEAQERIRARQSEAARQRLTALINEGAAIATVLRLLQRDDWPTKTINELDNSLKDNDRRKFYEALAIYADDVRRFRIDSAVWDARMQAAEHEAALMQSKSAAAQWDNLLRTMAKVLAEYHASGIKKAEIAEFFKALGLVAVGVGAAQ